MRTLTCIFCGHEEPVSLVDHINQAHQGLEMYLDAFPNAHVIAEPYLSAIVYEHEFQASAECECPNLSEADRCVIAKYHALSRPVRSEILITED